MFVYETHGIHAGTGKDHLKHGIDNLEEIVRKAIDMGHPSVTFIVHTPRLTGYRYDAERRTDIKFIRGDAAYFRYGNNIKELKKKYGDRITIIHGIELEWLGTDLGLQWNKSKIFQADGIDFVIGSIHFSKEKIAYDGSIAETERLLERRGDKSRLWVEYLEEMMEMVDTTYKIIDVVGHIDLPKLYTGLPECFAELDDSDEPEAVKMRLLLEKISEYNLSLDVNMAGHVKGCGIYPQLPVLKRARALNIPVTIGTDCHHAEDYGRNYKMALDYIAEAGYTWYLSYRNGIPIKHPVKEREYSEEHYNYLNLAIELLKRRFSRSVPLRLPNLSFGGKFRDLLSDFPGSTASGDTSIIRARTGEKSITVSDKNSAVKNQVMMKGLYSHHRDDVGVLSLLFNALASESINVETAWLDYSNDRTATAFLTLSGQEDRLNDALEFASSTRPGSFLTLEERDMFPLRSSKKDNPTILEIDGIEMNIPISSCMIITSHKNSKGVLLILLSALASVNVNVKNLQLGKRGNKAYAVLGVEGEEKEIKDVLSRLGSSFHEASCISLSDFTGK
ncbi:histidinol-phosphatase HisJ family protein [Spirochaeta isovalerica]|uniref:histidinol-phosphatase n=1 Tax=Spirochaeta isovalerica TaxID=150 RepID=A0A841RDX8_9SPIO|nr:histidinol-phosphatase HisJ family protein [Spirochaeta isovalerica]MBB6480572.1 histidinol-phosphatase (PHP family) [Spirochaeta isovalerica]